MDNAIKIIKLLRLKGHKTYIVGGWVRDYVMTNAPGTGDIDITTSATPEQVTAYCKDEGYNVIPTGIDHGTVTVMVENVGYEITTFRKDISCDGRNATIEYSKAVEEDLLRRDFTINAMAYCPLTENIIDPYGGLQDIKDKVIRCVGSAETRFKEDYLRMFRAFRFASVLNFTIETNTLVDLHHLALYDSKKIVRKISSERIKAEIDKVFLKSDKPSEMFRGLQEATLLYLFMPELADTVDFEQNRHHLYDVFNHTLRAVDAVPKEYPLIRYAALFHDLGKVPTRELKDGDYTFHKHELESVDLAHKVMARLRFSVNDREYIKNLVKHHMFRASHEMKDSAVRRFVASLGREYVDDICILKYADRVGNGKKDVEEINIQGTLLRNRFDKILAEETAFKVKDLKVTGADVMAALNIPQGIKIGEILKEIFDKVLEGELVNDREVLLKYLTSN